MGIIAVSLIAYGIMMHDWVLSVIFLLTAGVYFLLRNQHPKIYTVRLFENGIEIDGELSTWDNWQSCWILLGTTHAELHMLPAKSRKQFVVLIDGPDPFVVRDVISQYVNYDAEKKEKIVDAFIRFSKL